MVEWCRLVVPQVLEASHVRVTEHEWQVGVPIVDTTKLLTLEICLHVVLNDWCLGMCGMLSSSGLSIDGSPKAKMFSNLLC